MKLSLRHLQTLLLFVSLGALIPGIAGCGSGGVVTVTPSQPAPVAATLTPSSVVAGSGAFTLTVTGSNFISGAVVNINGSSRTTTFVSATQLNAAILATDVAAVATPSVTVTNPSAGGTSNGLTLTITAPSVPVPLATALTPSSAVAGSGAFNLTVTGLNFVSGSVVNFNGSSRITTFVSATQLTAAILATDVATVGTSSVTVTNPAPGGGTSNGLTFTVSSAPIPPAAAFTGTVKAGAQPIVEAAIQLYAVGRTGNGSAATPLLANSLQTDSTGSFSIPATFTCPAGVSQIYIVARGGRLAAAASANTAIALTAMLGLCNQIPAASQFVVNEVTTVATVWALSQFLSASGSIGASATNSVGMANAVATAANLANPITGTAPGAAFPSNGSSPAPRINSLANLLNTCTSAASSAAAACTSLLGSAPDTIAAAFQIARNAGTNVAALYTQSLASTVYSPVLTKAPSDWVLFVNYTGGGLNIPTTLSVDGFGNVWVASYFAANNANPDVGLLAEFSPVGKPVFPNGITGSGLSNVYGMAIDAGNNIWVANQKSPGGINGGFGSVSVFNSAGQPISGPNGYSAGGLYFPTAVGIDPDTSVWVVDNGNSHVTKLSSSGAPLSGPVGYTADSIAFGVAIAVDASHNAWIGDTNDSIVTRISSDGTKNIAIDCCNRPNSLAIDQAGNLWVANNGGNSVSMVSPAGVVISNGAYLGNNNFAGAQGIAIDGAGSIWVGNFRAGYLNQLAGVSSTNPAPGQPLSPSAGWGADAKLFGTYAVAIDASGNLWVSNEFSDSITQFIGLATPVKTPVIGPPQTP